ncbi:unnamed protein product [Ambrosiozyma monospora]|uniref:Unnamed protein product n=1 Tax=Ambrosiozyma monospora TaxID=43982 RepID=A0ACB5T879_AMBMO|nr:unnamed protein product [Ambrosiozyma monospora]
MKRMSVFELEYFPPTSSRLLPVTRVIMTHLTLDKKTLEILKFLLDWNSLLTQQPIGGAISEIYFYFISTSQSRGKDKVSWLQFIKGLRTINKICNGNALCCQPSNALQFTYVDPFQCFNRIVDINRLALSLIMKSIKPNSFKSSNNNSSNTVPINNNTGMNSNNTNTSSNVLEPINGVNHANHSHSSSHSSTSSHSIASATTQSTGNTSMVSDISQEGSETVPLVEVPKDRAKRLEMLMDLIDGSKTKIGAASNDIYPCQTVTNSKLTPKSASDIYTTTSKFSTRSIIDPTYSFR